VSPPPPLLLPQPASVTPTARRATAGREARRREELFTSVLLKSCRLDAPEVRRDRWTGMAASVNGR
jgi:hypothetical protein